MSHSILKKFHAIFQKFVLPSARLAAYSARPDLAPDRSVASRTVSVDRQTGILIASSTPE
jgi:hypothetical protein